jgi:tRNA(adenine34) deaminase
MVLARLPRLVYAARGPKAGAAGSVLNVLEYPQIIHQVGVTSGLMAGESAGQFRAFFAALRAEGQKH